MRRIHRLAVAATAALTLAIPAVALTGSASSAAPAAQASIPATAPCNALPASSAPATYSHVALIMFENKPLKKIVGNTTDAPYLNSLINACSYSKNDLSLSTTSLANYVALTSGYTGCTAVDANFKCTQLTPITANKPSSVWPQASKSIFELMGPSAAEWNESAPSNCALAGSGDYVDNHAPYHYYTRTQPQNSLCPLYDQPFPASPAATLSAKFNLVIPNKPDIMHKVPNTTIAQRIQNGDNWAKTFIPQLLNSASYQLGNTAIIITWDEGNATQFLVPLIVITPYTTAGGVSSVSYNHYSVLKGIQQMVGAATPLLGHAGDSGLNSIRDDGLFGLKPLP
ncbi:MAG: alkaline phosphatase family protein [Actinomycetota bacterium]|nr:alkaline phosphatase family protein [Actinomycetota bacterium]